MKTIHTISIILIYLLLFGCSQNQENLKKIQDLEEKIKDLRHNFNRVAKRIDDAHWEQKLSSTAFVEKVELTGPPMGKEKNIEIGSLDTMYLTNPFRIKAYVFVPKTIKSDEKHPLLVFPHGGVHSNFSVGAYAHLVRELIAQGYIVVAPEYRGSTGYGKQFYQSIDYGGKENGDVKACRDFMIANYPMIDSTRVGIMGWSHGGMISLMNIFNYPDSYQVAYAGVPVSDVLYRLDYKPDRYDALYTVDYHIGKSQEEAPDEYKRRSPAWQADKLQTPLLIHTNTNDCDVHVSEVEKLIEALKKSNKEFSYKIYQDLPGGHRFDRMHTMKAKEIRLKIYQFIAQYLAPPKPFENLEQLNTVSINLSYQ